MRPFSFYSTLLFTVGCYILGGCSTESVKVVNQAAEAQWKSSTDQISRVMARQSQSKLSQREQNYRLGADDILEITIFEWEVSNKAKTVEVRVSEDGTIVLPILGILQATGKSTQEIQANLEKKLQQDGILVNPQISVYIKEFRSKRITVVGAVEKPGVFHLRRNVTTLLDVLGEAGGLNEKAGYLVYVIKAEENPIPPRASKALPSDATRLETSTQTQTTASSAATADAEMSFTSNPSSSQIIQGMVQQPGQQKIAIDMYELVELGNLELNIVLENDDVVYIPNAQEFAVTGHVKKAGSFPLRKPTTLLEAVAMAEGLNEIEASPEYCLLKRRDKTGIEQLLPIDLVAIAERKAPDIYVEPNDVLIVRQTMGKYIYTQFKEFVNFTFGADTVGLIRGD